LKNCEACEKFNQVKAIQQNVSKGGIILTLKNDSAPSIFTIEGLMLKANIISQFP
jgi:hypothetical protein